jgi:hypothetical protein
MFEGREDFAQRVQGFLDDPAGHLDIARRGQELVRERHTSSARLLRARSAARVRSVGLSGTGSNVLSRRP